MKTMTLQQFYLEAKLLIEKYNFKYDVTKYWLEVECSIVEKNGAPKLECSIFLRNDRHDSLLFLYDKPTIDFALSELENQLAEKTGLGSALNSVTIEIQE